jgi:hypothetical protein
LSMKLDAGQTPRKEKEDVTEKLRNGSKKDAYCFEQRESNYAARRPWKYTTRNFTKSMPSI